MKHIINALLLLILVTNSAVSQQTTSNNTSKLSTNYINTSDNTKLFAKVSGSGPVCIFIHGGPGMWSKSFEDLKGNNLEKKLKMVYYDQRGCGRSDISASKDYSLDRMIEDIEDIRRSLGVEKIYLMSHSFGGIIAVNYAKKYPNRLYGLILLNSTLSINNSIEGQIKHINEMLNTHFEVGNKDLLSTLSIAKDTLSKTGLDYKLLSDTKKTVELVDSVDKEKPNNNDFGQNVWNIKEYRTDFTTMTKSIDIPVLVITGKKDYAVGVNHYKLFKFPHQKVVSIDGGHVLYFEKNKEFTQTVFSFINTK